MKRNEIFMRDPFLYVENGIGYLVGTTCKNGWSGPATGFLGYITTDLENFEGPFTLFENTDDFWAEENFWAPELHKYKDKYYLVASFYKKGKCRASQMLVCDKPMGKYIPLEKPFTPEEWECLDATLFEENGKLYTIFCHEFVQTHDGEMCLAELNDDLTSLKDKPIVLFKASSAPWVVSHNFTDPNFTTKDFVTDGPFIHRLKSGKLLMLWSSDCKDGYAMGMAISCNGINGPWQHIKEPLFSKDGGHGMYFEFKGKKYVSLHHPNMPFLSERPYFLEVEEMDDRLIIKQQLN